MGEVEVGLHVGAVLELLGGEPEDGKGTEPLPGGGGELHHGTENRAAIVGGVREEFDGGVSVHGGGFRRLHEIHYTDHAAKGKNYFRADERKKPRALARGLLLLTCSDVQLLFSQSNADLPRLAARLFHVRVSSYTETG